MIQAETITDAKLEEAYKIMAGIVSRHGEIYLLVFKRIHEAMEERKEQKALLLIAKRLTK